MLASVSIWSFASAVHAFAGGIFSFGAARALLGFGEGATFPGGLRTATQTLPAHQRSRGIAIAYSGGSLGALITPLIITPIAQWYGWRNAFWFTGFLGLGWVALWAIISRNVSHSMGAHASIRRPGLRDRRLWAFMSIYALGALPLAFVIYGAAIFLSKVRGLTQVQIGAVLWIPPLGWEVGYFFWGWVSDRFLRGGKATYNQLFLSSMVLSLPLALISAAPLPVVMFEFFFSMFVAAGVVILAIAYATDEFSGRHAGFIAGVGAGSWSALVAVVMPVFGRLFDASAYSAAFAVAAAFPIAGYAGWRALSLGQTGGNVTGSEESHKRAG
jgi:ACS family hexuronate transporter-like MFS transporter